MLGSCTFSKLEVVVATGWCRKSTWMEISSNYLLFLLLFPTLLWVWEKVTQLNFSSQRFSSLMTGNHNDV